MIRVAILAASILAATPAHKTHKFRLKCQTADGGRAVCQGVFEGQGTPRPQGVCEPVDGGLSCPHASRRTLSRAEACTQFIDGKTWCNALDGGAP